MDKTYEALTKQFGEKIRINVPLAPFTTYKVGGPADLFFDALTGKELVEMVTAARNVHIPFFILGGGSNILVSDAGFAGLVIKNSTSTITIRGIKGKLKGQESQSFVFLEADSGVPMNKLVRFTIEEGLSGLEKHLGLPGTVGGAICMNSKWMNPPEFVGDTVYQAVILTPKNVLKNVGKDYFHFSYGVSSLRKNDDILISVIFKLQKSDTKILWGRAQESMAYRRATQPQGVHTAGCVFKNITPADALSFHIPDLQTSAGFLLDAAGCKGMKIGKAEISPLHANFILTHPGAKARDVVELIGAMKRAVRQKFGVHLKEEILLIGEFSQ